MKLQHTIGENEKIEIEIERNWLTGSFVYRLNGVEHRIRSAWKLGTHFDWQLVREYEFEIGEVEKFDIKIVHSRHRWFGGIRPQKLELWANESLLETFTGL